MARPKRGRGSLHARDGQEGGGKTGGQEKAHQNCGGLCHTMELILQQVSWCSTERESSIKKGPKISFSRAFRQVAISCAGNVAKAPFLEASPRRIAAGEGSLSGWRSRCRYRAGVRRAMRAEWANAASYGPASRDDGRSLVRETWVSMFSLNRKSRVKADSYTNSPDRLQVIRKTLGLGRTVVSCQPPWMAGEGGQRISETSRTWVKACCWPSQT